MAGRDVKQNQLPVIDHGAPVGILSRNAIVGYREVRRSLGVENVPGDECNQVSHAV